MPDYLTISVRASRTMLPNATLKVGTFGPVQGATIELAPFVMLVGRNNTGKSYIANLIWAFRNFRTTMVGRNKKESVPTPRWFRSFIEADHEASDFAPLEIFGWQIAEQLNGWIQRNERRIPRRILSYSGAPFSDVEVIFKGSLWLRRTPKPALAFGLVEGEFSSWEISYSDPRNLRESTDGMNGYTSHTLRSIPEDVVSELFLDICEKFLLAGKDGFGPPTTYLPAARSGLMLALPSLYASILEDFGLGEESDLTGQLPLATVRFLQSLTRRRMDSTDKRHSEIAEFLEKDIVRGSINREEDSSSRFSYAPSGININLPLHVTSSLVSEIAPFLFLLRTGGLRGGIVFEEPEAHLHLAAQRSMARAIARLRNDGTSVTLTTHSDTFIQQLNVLGRLNRHPDKERIMKKHGYVPSEVIDLSSAICYEFRRGRHHTKVVRLRPSELGFAVPSLNETLIDLAEESVETNMDD